MAVGNTINVSIPVVGTTLETFQRSSGNAFVTTAYTINSVDYSSTLSLRNSQVLTGSKAFGLTARIDPSLGDDPGVVSKGACTVAINVQWRPGSVMTNAEMSKFVRTALSAALHANLLEDLSNGVAL